MLISFCKDFRSNLEKYIKQHASNRMKSETVENCIEPRTSSETNIGTAECISGLGEQAALTCLDSEDSKAKYEFIESDQNAIKYQQKAISMELSATTLKIGGESPKSVRNESEIEEIGGNSMRKCDDEPGMHYEYKTNNESSASLKSIPEYEIQLQIQESCQLDSTPVQSLTRSEEMTLETSKIFKQSTEQFTFIIDRLLIIRNKINELEQGIQNDMKRPSDESDCMLQYAFTPILDPLRTEEQRDDNSTCFENNSESQSDSKENIQKTLACTVDSIHKLERLIKQHFETI
jgi:hypothetical protein